MNNNLENNLATIIGTIDGEFLFDHITHDIKFYTFTICIPRLSGTIDRVRVIISEDIIMNKEYLDGDKVKITGQFRSYNGYEHGEKRLFLYVFAKNICKVESANEDENETEQKPNLLYLDGYICKAPVYRITPSNKEITDILVAVNRNYNKSDYIPVIAWGKDARFAKKLKVGDNVRISGRIQSRNYQKRISDEETIDETTYEISANYIKLVGNVVKELI